MQSVRQVVHLGGVVPALAAFSRSSCSSRSFSSRVSRFSGGLVGCSGGLVTTVIGGGVVLGLGGSGTSIRNSVPPVFIRIGSPFCISTTWQKMLRCCPAGLVLSTVTLNTSSL